MTKKGLRYGDPLEMPINVTVEVRFAAVGLLDLA